MINYAILTILIVLIIVAFFILFKISRLHGYIEKIDQLINIQNQIENNLKGELSNTKNDINSNFRLMLDGNDRLLGALDRNLKEKMEAIEALLSKSLSDVSIKQEKLIQSNEDKLDKFALKLESQTQTLEKHLDSIRQTTEEKLEKIRVDNEAKLEQMRQTVDEKLHESLEKKLGESFKQVSDRLEMVYKGLGEMQTLANGVGDLKRVLTNVKNRGILGELQLEKILDDILSPAFYEKNVKVKPNSNEVVEFAIKLPGNHKNETVYLPLDSKFPIENYQRLLDYYETGQLDQISNAQKALEQNIRQSAKDIKTKYIEVPYTTDFGIMFLPYEGLYSEVLRIDGLFESIMKEYKVVITGPTTLAAFLNSLQMGFRTLTIEKNAHKIMETLLQVKKEFEKFGDVLEKAQSKIKAADKELEDLVGVRTRKIQLALKDVQTPTDNFFPLNDN
ncbi:DNA recombination protein RmuC [Desulfurella sp.]|uniref:DNA recombination protein RmuC n=1 Tax=Desulfurella sp. TaxID=1962857 RepID=UPI0025C739AC|nr:DNA recombination protein RmuC [Desulfurella sp.]